ncbi:MAG: N-acetylmuramoyl-L-alanine amidase [Luteolibacter sp.]
MSRFSVRHLPWLIIAIFSLTGGALFLFRKPTPTPVVPKPQLPPASLSLLADPPNWPALDAYQDTITREDFERLLSTVFTTGEAWRNLIEVNGTEARIKTGDSAPADVYRLRFATPDATKPTPRLWKTADELPITTREKPLASLRIAIDPGHIGGEWAKMEERWFVVGDGQPVCEGDMTLLVAKLLKPKLEALGATVTLVRDKNEPVTLLRPDSLLTLAKESATPATPESPQKLAERLFYRTAEIHARAKLVNESIKPDIVLCLHFNAEAWGDPKAPTLIDRTHLHLLVNGGYNNDEVMLADQRFALLQKLLQRTQQEEILVGSDVASSFAEISGLPPYQYPPENTNVRPIPGQPYLWARNLLANRLYDCPVIFIEPYVMNSKVDYERIQAGDYEGLLEIGGKMRPSIFHEYADSLTQGLKNHYLKFRKFSD